MLESYWEYFLTSMIAILVIVNPLSTIAVFLSLTKGMTRDETYKTAFLSSLVAFCVLIFFSLTGLWIFKIYSITIDAFRIAGGIALLAIGLDMLFKKGDTHKHASDFEHVYIVPLAIPLTSGPGAITATVVLSGQVPDLWYQFIFWGAIFTACAINYLALRFSHTIDRILGNDGLTALIKIMGLLVASIGVQFIITGLKVAFPILG